MDGAVEMDENRREFLKTGLKSAVVIAATERLGAWHTPRIVLGANDRMRRPKLCFPTAPRDRLAVTSYPFRAYIDAPANRQRDPSKPGMTLLEFPARMVEKFGIYNINPVIDHFASTDTAYLELFRETVWKAGSHIVDFGLDGRSFYGPDPDEREKSIAYGKRGIDIALAIGSPSIRQHLAARPGVPPNVGLAAESLGRLAEYGSKQNIVVNLENDAAISESPFFLVEVIEKVNDPYLRALPDFGNSIRGHDQEYNERGLREMFAHAFNIAHVKERLRVQDGRAYHVNLPDVFAIARANSYQGYFSMEFDTQTNDPYEGTQKLIDMTLKCLSS